MCGIAGMIGKSCAPTVERVQAMIDIIQHRGPDGEGLFIENDICLGHRRLAIIDLRPEGHQPMEYINKYVITFNGEIYNYLELKEELHQLGYSFFTKTDTEVILAAYDCWGQDCIRRFNGMWAFAIYDRKENTIFCSRDRFGVKPFYYRDAKDAFYFGSEIKQIWINMPKPVKANRDILLAFLTTFQRDYSEQTMFEDVYQLPAGHNLIYNVSEKVYQIKKWYTYPKNNPKEAMPYQEAVKQFKEMFYTAVQLRLRSDVPVGCTLSGGMDSSAITCTANKIKSFETLHTISSCFKEKTFDEQVYIDEVISYTKVKNHKVWPDTHVNLEKCKKAIWYSDEPGTSIAGYEIYREARKQNITVMLVGEGADEELAGYTEFFEALFSDLLKNGRLKELLLQIKKYKQIRESDVPVTLKHLLSVVLADGILPTELRDRIRVARPEYAAAKFFTSKTIKNRQVYKARNLYSKMTPKNIDQIYLFYEMQMILHDLDRASMASSIETRAPFLDYQLAEVLCKMPLEYKLWDGVTKRVMRDALESDMPSAIIQRYGKMGFMSPEFQWLYENPDEVIKTVSRACDALGDYVDKNSVIAWCEEQKGKPAQDGAFQYMISNLFQVGLWLDVFQVEIPL